MLARLCRLMRRPATRADEMRSASLTTEKTVAIIGASEDRGKFGNKAVRAHAAEGWTVYPVHPTADEIEGLTVYRSVADVPRPVRRVTLYVPPKVGVTLLEAIAAVEPEEFILNPGTESEAMIRQSKAVGLQPRLACSIVDIGRRPSEFV